MRRPAPPGPQIFSRGRFRRLADCADCGRYKPVHCRGLCDACRSRHQAAGTIGEFGYAKADRLADYALLRRLGEPVVAAAGRVGVSQRTAWRYEAELRRAAA